MKILHVVPTYLPARRYGGPIVAVHGLCKALVKRGHDVDVFTTNVNGDRPLDVPVATPVDLDGVRVTYFPSPFPRLYWSPGMGKALAEIGRYDVAHLHSVYLWPTWAAARAAEKRGVPYLIAPRGMLVPELIQQKSRIVKSLWLRLIERHNFTRASAIHFTSQLEWDDAKRTGMPLPAPIIVPNGIDLVPRPAVARDARTIVFLGRINWKKGLEHVIAALPSVPDARLVIAGNDEERLTPRLVELAQRYGVADRVEFLGPIYGDAKYELLARATLFVLLSTSENFGNVVLEALSMETPVVVSRGVGLADEVARVKGGVIADKRTLATVVNELLGDPQRAAEMGCKGRALVESRFVWDRVAAQMEEVYERCSTRSPR
ncbi:MAG TPA: glycosyltransferase [Thermoanaerobaculia bacterium]